MIFAEYVKELMLITLPPSEREGDRRRVPGNALAAFLGFGRKRWKEPAPLNYLKNSPKAFHIVKYVLIRQSLFVIIQNTLNYFRALMLSFIVFSFELSVFVYLAAVEAYPPALLFLTAPLKML